MAGDVVASNVIVALAGGMEGELIAEFLTGADDTTRSAFARSASRPRA
jgi:hypothetical protein